MTESVLDQLVRQIGFQQADFANLKTLAPVLDANAANVVDRFYESLDQHPGMRAILRQSDATAQRLRLSLTAWIKSLPDATLDSDYADNRARIGHAHVHVGMPQHFMISAMWIIKDELHAIIKKSDVAQSARKLRSLDKLLALELGLMLESYKDQYAAGVKATERSRVEEQLSRAEHLAEFGKLAASLAHEIKNPLAGISGAIQIIRDGMDPEYKHREIIGEILGQINRLDAVVKDLLVYARPLPPRLTYCDIDAIVRRVISFMREESSAKRARLEFVADGKDVCIQADEAKIEQLILNLVLNAAQASPPGTAIRIETSTQGDWVRLEVADSGHGMDDNTRQRAFEPFFTTKAKGTGLGLPICKTIVETHGGRISLDSADGRGTRVVVEFPREQN